MTKQNNFKEELHKLFNDNKELLPEISQDAFEVLVNDSFEVYEHSFNTPMESREDLLEAAIFFNGIASMYAIIMATTYEVETVLSEEDNTSFECFMKLALKEALD